MMVHFVERLNVTLMKKRMENYVIQNVAMVLKVLDLCVGKIVLLDQQMMVHFVDV